MLELREPAAGLLFLRPRLGNLPPQGFGNADEIALGAGGPRDGGACGLEVLLESFDRRFVPHQCVADPRVLPFQPAEPPRRREVVPRQRGGRCHEQRHEWRSHWEHESSPREGERRHRRSDGHERGDAAERVPPSQPKPGPRGEGGGCQDREQCPRARRLAHRAPRQQRVQHVQLDPDVGHRADGRDVMRGRRLREDEHEPVGHEALERVGLP
jgi:hypothetical protein